MGPGMEKRSLQRLDIPLDILVGIETSGGFPPEAFVFPSKSRNLSQKGICLETAFIEIGGVHLLAGPPGERRHRLRMKIPLRPEEPAVSAAGEVRWYDVDSDGTGNIYRLGVEFTEMAAREKERLRQFLKAFRPAGSLFSQAARGFLRRFRSRSKPDPLPVAYRVTGPE